MCQQRANYTGFHSETTPPKSKCHINSSKFIVQGKVMRNVHPNTEYVVLFRNTRDKSQFGHLTRQLEPNHSKALVDTYMDTTSRPYSYLLVHLKPHTPDALCYRSNSIQLDRQTVYILRFYDVTAMRGAVPT